jgi:hypothetical protein
MKAWIVPPIVIPLCIGLAIVVYGTFLLLR